LAGGAAPCYPLVRALFAAPARLLDAATAKRRKLLACADIDAATAEVTAQFDVDQQTATGDVRALLAELRSAGLVTG
jgi:predicted deacylase